MTMLNLQAQRLGAFTLIVGLMAWPVTAQPASDFDAGSMVDPAQMQRIEAAVDKALGYLVTHQRPDGSWPSGGGNNNGVNAICLLALLGRGHTPSRGPYQQPILRAVNFIYSTQNKGGLYQTVDRFNGVMYEHALATLAMIEAYGYLPEPRLHQSVQKALDLIVKAQNKEGGWRYQPHSKDADLSVTVMQVVALHAGRNARFNVPNETMERALAYTRSLALPNGGFAYMTGRNSPAAGRTAAGILCMQLLGAFDDPIVEKAFEYVDKQDYGSRIKYFWYFNYYAMQANFQAGGERWIKWSTMVREYLLERQGSDGSWPSIGASRYNGSARCYSTAFGAMTMQVFLHYLPAYQR